MIVRHRSVIAWTILILILAYIWGGQHTDTQKVKKQAAHNTELSAELKRTVVLLKSTVTQLAADEAKLKSLDQHVTFATCEKLNKLEGNISSFLSDSSVRSKRNAQAIVKSPFSTAAEKDAARKNLKEINRFINDFKKRFPKSHCESAFTSHP